MSTEHDLSTALERTSLIIEEFKIDTLGPRVRACRDLLARGNILEVGVWGRFKAGKSSFLNALVGKNVLPVGVLPVTSVITKLGYGPEEKAVVRFLTGERWVSPVPAIAFFVSEIKNPGNEKRMATLAWGLRNPSRGPPFP